jgi:hypothetical protein
MEPGRKGLIAWGVLRPDPAFYHLTLYPWDRYNVVSYVMIWVLPSALLATLALSFTLSARWKTVSARTPSKATRPGELVGERQPPSTLEVSAVASSFFLCALLPFLAGIWLFTRGLQIAFERSAEIDPWEKMSFMLAGVARAERALRMGATAGVCGLAISIAIAAWFMRSWRKQGMTWTRARGHSRRVLSGCGFLLLLAGVVAWQATPLRKENHAAWPSLTAGGTLRVWPALPAESISRNPLASTLQFYNEFSGKMEPLAFPLLQGTEDGARTTTTLGLGINEVRVNGIRQDATEVREELQAAINNHALLHPEDDRHDRLSLVSTPDVAGTVVGDWLDVAYAVGFREVGLASGRLETIRRPALGLVSRVHFMTTPTRLHRSIGKVSADGNTVRLSCRDFPRYQELLAVAIQQRQQGKEVILVLPPE